jgi:cytochrome c
MRILLIAVIALLGGALDCLANPPAPDPAHGEQIYQRCLACHAFTYNRTGPRHCGLLGRRAGSLPDYAYSPAMKRANIVWTTKTLDAFLTAPTVYVTGTTMAYAGISDAAERRDLIAFLALKSHDAKLCGQLP